MNEPQAILLNVGAFLQPTLSLISVDAPSHPTRQFFCHTCSMVRSAGPFALFVIMISNK